MNRRSIRSRRAPLLAVAISLLATACANGQNREPIDLNGRKDVGALAARPKWQAARGHALIVMDMQNGYMPVHKRASVFDAIQRLVDEADAAGAPVVWVYTDGTASRPGTRAFEVAEPLAPDKRHARVTKNGPNAFTSTNLEKILDEARVGRVVICGLSSVECVRSTVMAASRMGYRVTVARDAHTLPTWGGAESSIASMNEFWREDKLVELAPASSIRFDAGGVAERGLTDESWAVSERLAGFLDDEYRKLLRRSPELATQFALSDWAGLDDTGVSGLSAEYLAESMRIEKEVSAALRAFDMADASPGDRLSYEAYKRAIDDSVSLHRFGEMGFLVNPTLFSAAYDARALFEELHPVRNEAEATSYVKRLSAMAARMKEAAGAMKRRAGRGVIAPKALLQAGVPMLEEVANARAEDTFFYLALKGKLDALSAGPEAVGESRAKALLDEAAAVIASDLIPVYRALAEEARAELPKAPLDFSASKLPDGKRYYEAKLREQTTTTLTPAEVHELGLRELKRIHAEIIVAGTKLGGSAPSAPGQALGAAFAPRNALGPAETLAAYRKLLADTEALLPGLFPGWRKFPVDVRTAPLGGYYQPGPIDGSLPGVFYVAEGTGTNKAGLPTLLYHETIPGHHLQISTANAQSLPVARKAVYFTAYVEGWALYAERLMAEQGAYADDPAGDIGRLQAEAHRAARLCADTGLHAMGWSFDQAVDFLMSQAFLSRRQAQAEVMRYACIPAQATAYYLGFQRILSLREKARTALGDKFSLPAFHRSILSCGSVPLDVLDAVVERYIAEAKAGF